jgi:hypothetical protein
VSSSSLHWGSYANDEDGALDGHFDSDPLRASAVEVVVAVVVAAAAVVDDGGEADLLVVRAAAVAADSPLDMAELDWRDVVDQVLDATRIVGAVAQGCCCSHSAVVAAFVD